MAINILNNPHGGGIGAALGSGISSGIAESLQNLARERLAGVKERTKAAIEEKKLEAEAKPFLDMGYSPQQWNFIKQFTPKDRLTLVDRLEPMGQQSMQHAAEQQQQFAQQALPQEFNQLEKKANLPQLAGLQALGTLQSPFQPNNLTPESLTQQYSPLQELINLGFSSKEAQDLIPQLTQAQKEEPVKNKTKDERIAEHKALKSVERSEAQNILGLKKQTKSAAEITREEKKQARIDSETLPVYNENNALKEAANFSDAHLNKMEQLIDKGQLPYGVVANLLHDLAEGQIGVGPVKLPKIDLTAILGADAAEFNKLSKDFLKGAKAIFGNRVTQDEVKRFLDTIPSLAQTDQGKRQIIANMRVFNQAAKLKNDAMNEIITENNGERPRDLAQQIDKRTKDSMDELYDFFKPETKASFPGIGRATQFPVGMEFTVKPEKPFPGGEYLQQPERYKVWGRGKRGEYFVKI